MTLLTINGKDHFDSFNSLITNTNKLTSGSSKASISS